MRRKDEGIRPSARKRPRLCVNARRSSARRSRISTSSSSTCHSPHPPARLDKLRDLPRLMSPRQRPANHGRAEGDPHVHIGSRTRRDGTFRRMLRRGRGRTPSRKGSFRLRVLDSKMRNVGRTGADVLATANPGCVLQLQYGAQRYGPPVEVKYVTDLLDEAYQREDD